MTPTEPDLPAPAVPPAAYDADYFLRSNIGAAAWRESDGHRVDPLYHGYLVRAGLRAGEVLVDLGTGRGDLLAAAIAGGAARAYGVEYSPDAVALAQRTLAAHGITDRARVMQADARAVPLDDGIADLVCLLEVAEHLTPAELARALREARRILKPGGRILIHTMPNRLIYTVTYRLLRAIALGRWPSDPRNDYERQMHVNEMTAAELRRALAAAGLAGEVTLGEWIYTDHVPARWGRRAYRVLARLGPLSRFARADIWALARRAA